VAIDNPVEQVNKAVSESSAPIPAAIAEQQRA
jgi:hypothetical protein